MPQAAAKAPPWAWGIRPFFLRFDFSEFLYQGDTSRTPLARRPRRSFGLIWERSLSLGPNISEEVWRKTKFNNNYKLPISSPPRPHFLPLYPISNSPSPYCTFIYTYKQTIYLPEGHVLHGFNIFKKGKDPVVKPRSYYPDWLWTVARPQPTLEELERRGWINSAPWANHSKFKYSIAHLSLSLPLPPILSNFHPWVKKTSRPWVQRSLKG